MKIKQILAFSLFLLIPFLSIAETWKVGTNETYTKPSQIMNLVGDGDSILIFPGNYLGDTGTWTNNNLIIVGVQGQPHMQAGGNAAQDKAIWVITGDSITIDNIQFSGAAVADKNGAGIRVEGLNLTIRNCYFHDNENGILTTNDKNLNLFVEFSEFGNNGYGDGMSHNIYVGEIHSFTMQYCYFHHAKVGHQIKSRAENNFIKYNYITDGSDGNSSYLVDLPNGGFSILIGNILVQSSNATNGTLIAYGLEGLTNTYNKLRVVNNTLISERSTATFFKVQADAQNVQFINNLLAGPGEILNGPGVKISNIHTATIEEAGFVDFDNQDFSLLKTSPAIDKSVDPGELDEIILTAASEYIHPISGRFRQVYHLLDIGAMEYNWPVENVDLVNLEYNLFPNPVQNQAVLNFESNASNHNLFIFNNLGHCIQTLKQINQNKFDIDSKSFESGMYFFQLELNGDIIGNGKFLNEK